MENSSRGRNKMAGVPAQFSSDEFGALKREAENHPLAYTEAYRKTCLHKYYEVQRCTVFIQENGFKRVRLRLCVCSELYIYVTLPHALPTMSVVIQGIHYAYQIG